MQQEASDSKSYEDQSNGQRNAVKDIPGHWHPVKDQHSHNDQSTDTHFKCVHHHFYYEKNIFRKVNLGYNGLALFYDFYTLGHCLAEKDPHGISDKNKYGEIGLSCVKYSSENKGIDQHITKWFQNPPQPVQIRIGYFGF